MRRHFLVFFFLFSLITLKGQDYREVKFYQMDSLLSLSNDTLYVVNFWATWCKPCVEELPYFDELHREFHQKKMKIILVSLDFQKEIETKFEPFLAERELEAEVWYLNERKFSAFIPSVEEQWSGALPFTLFRRSSDGFRMWKEGKIEKENLFKILIEQL